MLLGIILIVLDCFVASPLESGWEFIDSGLNSFLHLNFVHLASNLTLIGLLSLYEKRVGYQRYLEVLFISLLASSCSYLFSQENSIGFSGGVFGLGVAYFVDERQMRGKEFLQGVFIVAIIGIGMSIYTINFQVVDFSIDHWGHFLGASSAATYIYLRKIKDFAHS